MVRVVVKERVMVRVVVKERVMVRATITLFTVT
jgi:hypothetical protein